MKIKKCAWCGQNANIKKYGDGTYKIVCENKNCPCETFKFSTVAEAVLQWNTRYKRNNYEKYENQIIEILQSGSKVAIKNDKPCKCDEIEHDCIGCELQECYTDLAEWLEENTK